MSSKLLLSLLCVSMVPLAKMQQLRSLIVYPLQDNTESIRSYSADFVDHDDLSRCSC